MDLNLAQVTRLLGVFTIKADLDNELDGGIYEALKTHKRSLSTHKRENITYEPNADRSMVTVSFDFPESELADAYRDYMFAKAASFMGLAECENPSTKLRVSGTRRDGRYTFLEITRVPTDRKIVKAEKRADDVKNLLEKIDLPADQKVLIQSLVDAAKKV